MRTTNRGPSLYTNIVTNTYCYINNSTQQVQPLLAIQVHDIYKTKAQVNIAGMTTFNGYLTFSLTGQKYTLSRKWVNFKYIILHSASNRNLAPGHMPKPLLIPCCISKKLRRSSTNKEENIKNSYFINNSGRLDKCKRAIAYQLKAKKFTTTDRIY